MTSNKTTTEGGTMSKDGNFSFSTAMIQLPLMVRDGGGAGSGSVILAPEDVLNVCADLRDVAQECFQVLALNAKNGIIDRVLVSMGTVDAAMVHPREVFRTAIIKSAAALVLVHNHPSGDTTPSAEDIRVTLRLIEAGRIIDIKVLDHCIIGRGEDGKARVLSMRESGLAAFK